MDEAAHRNRTGHPPAPSDEQHHREQVHEQAEELAVEGEDLSEILFSALGHERPHVAEPPPAGVSWSIPATKWSVAHRDNDDRPDED